MSRTPTDRRHLTEKYRPAAGGVLRASTSTEARSSQDIGFGAVGWKRVGTTDVGSMRQSLHLKPFETKPLNIQHEKTHRHTN